MESLNSARRAVGFRGNRRFIREIRRRGNRCPNATNTKSGPYFFGTAREAATLKPLQNVQIKAQLGSRRMFVNTNVEGRFKLPSFGKDTVRRRRHDFLREGRL